MQYGFFSKKAVNMGSHTSVYELDADGRPCGEAEVCCVYDDQVGADYRWDDKQCVGRVGNWLRDGRTGTYTEASRTIPPKVPKFEDM